jgi:GTP-binding protein EngB required for normal cell division
MEGAQATKKKVFFKYKLDGGETQTKKFVEDASLATARIELKLSPEVVFLMNDSELALDDECDTEIKEILDAENNFHLKTKAKVAAAPASPPPSVQRFPPREDAVVVDPDRDGMRILQYPQILMKADPDYPDAAQIDPSKLTDAKFVILMGQTGTGKSTTINAMVNYLQGVQPDDPFRYELIIDQMKKDQAESQTTEPHIYCIESLIDYPTVVIIDTPGYGDTGGLEMDEKIDSMIKELFQVKVEMIHLVCFVVKASMNRITAAENYVYSKVLHLFGNDIKDNFQFLITFCDGGSIQAEPSLRSDKSIVAGIIDSIESKKLPWRSLFNNSAVFKPVTSSDGFSSLFWKMYEESMRDFFSKLLKIRPQSLMMTRDVIKQRDQLNIYLYSLRNEFDNQVTESTNLQRYLTVIESNYAKMKANEKFQREITKKEAVKQPIKTGHYTTWCRLCDFTCHPICAYGPGESKEDCGAMSSGKCTVCKGKCEYFHHFNVEYTIVMQDVTITEIVTEIKELFNEATNELASKEECLLLVMKKLDALHVECLKIQDQMKDVINKLNKIALRPNCYDKTEEYILMMIENERKSQGGANLKKIELLEKVLEKNKKITQLMDNDPSLRKKPKHQLLEELLQQGAFTKKSTEIKSLL